jgi:RNA polymerase sigma factor (sigma-70 family)
MLKTEIIPGLFKTEFSKICSVLCKHLGIYHLGSAEDIASETFLSALETWPYKGVPENPTAWLYMVAKNKARNLIIRQNLFKSKIAGELSSMALGEEPADADLSDSNIADSQLQMLFAICDPSIPAESQIGLALRILCGFGIDEIANAFLTNRETINKRLFRAREKLRSNNQAIRFPSETELTTRLQPVLKTLYLLFNEGYYSESSDQIIREELAVEAMRLTQLLIENNHTNHPAVRALLAMMCFHSSRFAARTSETGQVILYSEQDESLWNHELIARGVYWLRQSSEGESYSIYHLEAAIAYWHTNKSDLKEKWENILQLYNRLLQVEYSPVAALNRTYALYKVKGKTVAIAEAIKLNLEGNRFYHALLGELYTGTDNLMAREQFQKAINLTRASSEKDSLERKLNLL